MEGGESVLQGGGGGENGQFRTHKGIAKHRVMGAEAGGGK